MKQKLLALSLSLTLCLSLLPAALATGKTYDQAVKELQEHDSQLTFKQSFETEYGTVFVCDSPNPHANTGWLRFVTKALCAKGEGEVVSLPHPCHSIWCNTKPPLTAQLSDDKTTFTYTYHYDEPLINGLGPMLRPAGDFIYTLDLTTGEVTENVPAIPEDYNTYAAALERVKNEEGWVVEQILEAPVCTVLLRYFQTEDGRRSYFLNFVYKVESAYSGEGGVVSHSLTITRDDGTGEAGFPVHYTHRAPDTLTLNEDKTLLTYTYSESLEGGADSETLELASGLSSKFNTLPTIKPEKPQSPTTEFSDVPAGSWFEQGVTICAQKGVMVGTGGGLFSPEKELTAAECLTLAVRLYDLQRGGEGTLRKAPEDWGYLTFTFSDGKTFYRYGEQNDFFGYARFDNAGPDGRDLYAVYVPAPGDTPEERETYAKAHEGKATLMAQGREYSGTVVTDSTYYGPCLRFAFDCPEAEQPDLYELFDQARPGPDRWYRDTAYTAEELGLRETEGFSTLLGRLAGRYPDAAGANREAFAKALAVAAGELEKKYDVPSIPDVERSDFSAGVYSLYEAGILNGLDSFGTFWGEKNLTRAECAVMVSRVLDPGQRLTSPPAVPSGYEQAVIDLRTSFGYYNEETIETPECTIFIFARGGFMNAPSGAIQIIYKPGSPLGDGYVLDPPHVRSGLRITPADSIDYDPEKGTFTYSYFFDTTAYDSSLQSYDARVEPGTFTFTVDLPTGKVYRDYRPVDYAGAMAHVTRKRNSASDKNQEVVKTLESDLCTAVLTKGRYLDQYDDYILSLVYKPGSPLGEGTIKQLLLPSTIYADGYTYHPTDRSPDSLELSPDGRTLTYVYRFDEALMSFHEAGTYTYTVDLATGELSVVHTAD